MRKLITTFLLTATAFVAAQNNPSAYNIKRALEAAQSGDGKEALGYLSKELKENPTNGYAHLYVTAICDNMGYKSPVLTYGAKTIKYLGKSEPDFVAQAAGLMADIYLESGDTVSALEYLQKGVALCKTRSETYGDLANIYEDAGRYDDMFAIGEQYKRLFPKNAVGDVIISSSLHKQGKDEEALSYADRALKMLTRDDQYRRVVRMVRSEALFGLGRYEAALHDAMESARMKASVRTLELIEEIADSVPGNMVLDSLQAAWENDRTQTLWLLTMSDIYRHRNDNINAILSLYKALKIEETPVVFSSLANLSVHYMASPEEGERLYKKGIELDSTNAGNYSHLADLYHDLKRYDDAIRYADKALQLCSTDKQAELTLMIRGRVYESMHNYEKAADDFYRCLTYKPQDLSIWFRIGKVHRLAGDSAAAEKAFEEGRRAMTARNGELDAEALIAVGEYDKAVEKVSDMLKNPEEPGEHYNAACVYAQAGRQQEAMDELRLSFEKGFRNFYHIVWDSDLDNIRALPEFIALVNSYKEMAEEEKAQLKALLEKI